MIYYAIEPSYDRAGIFYFDFHRNCLLPTIGNVDLKQLTAPEKGLIFARSLARLKCKNIRLRIVNIVPIVSNTSDYIYGFVVNTEEK